MKKNRQKNNLFSVSLLFFLLLSLFFTPLAVAGSTAMPAFSLASAADEKTIASEQFKGQVVLVTFFATWCRPCMEEIPSLIHLQDQFGKQGFSVVAISVDQSGKKPVKKVMDKKGINYPVLMADAKVTRDFGGIVGIPTSFLVNRDGNIVKSYPGYVQHAVFANDIEKIIQ